MAAPVVVSVDPERVITDALPAILLRLPQPSRWTYGTLVEAGVTPSWYIRVQAIGGTGEGVVAQRPIVDVRLWTDGTVASKGVESLAARTLLAHLMRATRCRTVAVPVQLPDPSDSARLHTLMSVQLYTKGTTP